MLGSRCGILKCRRNVGEVFIEENAFGNKGSHLVQGSMCRTFLPSICGTGPDYLSMMADVNAMNYTSDKCACYFHFHSHWSDFRRNSSGLQFLWEPLWYQWICRCWESLHSSQILLRKFGKNLLLSEHKTEASKRGNTQLPTGRLQSIWMVDRQVRDTLGFCHIFTVDKLLCC